jgi:SAM-dependent methyltransferase
MKKMQIPDGYRAIAPYYDIFTKNVDYDRYASYIDAVFKRNKIDGLVLDAGCGTGIITSKLHKIGYEMIGVDQSAEMLSIATNGHPGILFLCQDVTALDLYGTVQGAVATLDLVNHLPSLDAARRFFARVALFMEKDGIFLFDMNLPYKHDQILADHAFIYEFESGMLVWQNDLYFDPNRVMITLDLFHRENDGRYSRQSDTFYEYTYEPDSVAQLLWETGFKLIETIDGERFLPLQSDSESILYTAKRI